MKFRKKPVEVEAIQLNLEDIKSVISIYEWVNNVDVSTLQMAAESHIANLCKQHNGLPIKTLEGTMVASDKDWIIKGVNGEFYPCKPDIFEKTYEKVEE